MDAAHHVAPAELTETGEMLDAFARRLLLNDEALLARPSADQSRRRSPLQDFAVSELQQTLAQFSRAHLAFRIDIDRSATLLTQLPRSVASRCR